MRKRSLVSTAAIRVVTLLAVIAILMLGACIDNVADAILGDDGPKRLKPDTVVVHDTTVVYCRHHDPRPECRK